MLIRKSTNAIFSRIKRHARTGTLTTTMTDGQQSTHGSKYAYTTRYWPELYGLWVMQLLRADLEKYDAFFWDLVRPFL
ncbi:hypothetical protein BJX64DRAFT_286495 [Aspergillus heterothallicus]